MFELTFTAAFMLYLSITFFTILGIWIYSHYRMKKRVFFTIEKALFICEYCHFTYLGDSTTELNRCPQCQLFNKHNAYQKKSESIKE